MKNKFRNCWFYCFCLLVFVSCASAPKEKIIAIHYGVNFGRCVAYCEHTYFLTRDSYRKVDKAHSDTLRYPMKTETLPMKKKQWEHFLQLCQESNLYELPDVIGCPGCNDGGVEWLEIFKSNGTSKKVKFDYHADMGKLNPLLDAIDPDRMNDRTAY